MRIILKRTYGLPASITCVAGKWKTGKTDFSLFLTEMNEQLGLIRKFSSNIETDGSEIEFINDFQSLDYWLASSSYRKMYLYDEVIESTQRRRAMSRVNTEWVKRIPQLSKGRCHLVIITQELNLTESVFLNWTFLRGIWTKEQRKIVRFYNRQLSRNFRWRNLPKTSIGFDPYLPASFHLERAEMAYSKLPYYIRVCYDYGNKLTMEQIGIKEGKSKAQILKDLRKGMKLLVNQLLDNSDGFKKLSKVAAEA